MSNVRRFKAKKRSAKRDPFGIGQILYHLELPYLLQDTQETFRNKNLKLKFTQCRSDQFTCHTYGNCISIDKRCDGHPDCPLDGSDEKGCKFMTYLDGYNKKYPSGRNTTIVYMWVDIEDIYEIHELEMEYTVRLKVGLAWNDDRITFKNLKNDYTENLLDISEIENIWLPQVVISNSKDKLRVKAGNGDGCTSCSTES